MKIALDAMGGDFAPRSPVKGTIKFLETSSSNVEVILVGDQNILNQELGEPFRRDAMKKPVKVAGINPKDMRSQQNN